MAIPQTIIELFKHWQTIIDNSTEFTKEIEQLSDRIAWYCTTHNISVEEYNRIIRG